MNTLDTRILGMLIKEGRASYAEIARQLGVSRAHARERVQKLLEDGVIEQFTAVVNPEKLGKAVSAFFDVQVSPQGIESIAKELSELAEVVSLYVMSDMRSLHIHTLTKDTDALEHFAHSYLFGREHVVSIDCKTLVSRPKQRRGGPRL